MRPYTACCCYSKPSPAASSAAHSHSWPRGCPSWLRPLLAACLSAALSWSALSWGLRARTCCRCRAGTSRPPSAQCRTSCLSCCTCSMFDTWRFNGFVEIILSSTHFRIMQMCVAFVAQCLYLALCGCCCLHQHRQVRALISASSWHYTCRLHPNCQAGLHPIELDMLPHRFSSHTTSLYISL